jgi:hypothetical protein
MDTHMSLRNLAALFATIITLSFTQFTYAVPGDILQELKIKNNFNLGTVGPFGLDIYGEVIVGPTTPHGIAFYDNFMYVLDFGTDRIYKVYPQQVTDEDGTVHEAGDSPFNFPVDEPNGTSLLDPGGNPLAACSAYFDPSPPANQTAQYCGGGGLEIVNQSLWNASPVTDQIIKIAIEDGVIITENDLNLGEFPSPTSLAYDSTFFWILNWQLNTISKVNPTDGTVLASYNAGLSAITGTRPVGIVWDQKDLWISYEGTGEEIIYRVKPNDATNSLDILDSFSAPGSSDSFSKPKDLAFDGEFLWHSDAGTGKIYRLETDINPFGIVGCVEKNGIGVASGVLLSQTGEADKIDNTTDGCFQFPEFAPGVPITLELNEGGVTGKPFITLNETEPGSTDVILIVGTPYNETNYGFSVTDIEDDNATLTAAVTTTPNVTSASPIGTNIDSSVPNPTGIVVEYNVIDSEGNNAEPVYRTIYVLEADEVIPEIFLNGSSTMTIGQDISNADLYVEPNATATDNRDDNAEITALIVIGGDFVNTSADGIYEVTYDVSDEAGNPAVQVIRTITVKDTTPPAITILGSNPLQIEKGLPYVEAGAEVQDNVDGLVPLGGSNITGIVDTATVGTYIVNYSYADSGNNTVTANRTVNIVDTGEPTITLRGDSEVNHELNTTYSDAGAYAIDSTGETVSSNVPFTGTVNSTIPNTYTLTYNISDASNNAADPVTRTVVVADTGAPSITLIGNSTIDLQKGDTYNESGATATDVIDDDAALTAKITITSVPPLDTNTIGQYTLTYEVTDDTGNAATPVIRTVNVSDTGVPVITLIGNQTINLQKNDPYNEPGANATDSVDDNATLTAAITIGGDTINTSVINTYTRTYGVSDSAGNPAVTVTRTIIVSDSGTPVITLNGNQTINLQKSDTYTELGATATDAVDDDAALTADISITSVPPLNTNTIGNYTLTYTVADSAGNAAVPVTRTVTVSDTGMPVITLNGNQTINLQINDVYSELGATASDAVDDDATLTAAIIIDGAVDTSTNGSYPVTYNVTDSASNAAVTVTRTINVADTGTPVLSLVGNQTIYLQKGDAYIEQGATATDSVDNDATLTANIILSGVVNTGNIGTYTRTYSVTDTAGNAAVPITRTIDVSDNGIPAITLNGSSTINHEQGTPFSDPGATAFDAVDGDMGTILAPETVNISLADTYTLTYNISDGADNAAITVTRDVIVDDTIAPIITIIGSASINHEQGDTYTDQGATALDSLDGNVTVAITGAVNTNAGGTYTLSYNATDLAGNNATTVTRDVIVADTIIPTITMLGDAVMDHTSGTAFVDPGYTANDNFDGDITGDVATTFVNNSTEYLLSYNVSDNAGNAAVTQNRTVNVVVPSSISIEAETATIGGTSSIDILGSGWTGSGYVKIQDATFEAGDYLEYSITAFGVPYNLTIRYASLSDINPVEVILNGTSLGLLNLPPSGADDTYINSSDSFIITPLSGVNTLRFNLTDDYGDKRIDSLTLTPQ